MKTHQVCSGSWYLWGRMFCFVIIDGLKLWLFSSFFLVSLFSVNAPLCSCLYEFMVSWWNYCVWNVAVTDMKESSKTNLHWIYHLFSSVGLNWTHERRYKDNVEFISWIQVKAINNHLVSGLMKQSLISNWKIDQLNCVSDSTWSLSALVTRLNKLNEAKRLRLWLMIISCSFSFKVHQLLYTGPFGQRCRKYSDLTNTTQTHSSTIKVLHSK